MFAGLYLKLEELLNKLVFDRELLSVIWEGLFPNIRTALCEGLNSFGLCSVKFSLMLFHTILNLPFGMMVSFPFSLILNTNS